MPACAEIPPAEVHLWCCQFLEIEDVSLLREYRKLLSEAERCQEWRFNDAHDRRRYLVTRALVRTVLSRYAALAPESWVFATNAYGRPEVVADDIDALRLSFNVTHTSDLIVLAVTRDKALGVDTENVKARRRCPEELATHFFAPAEADEIRNLPASRQAQRFYEYWTLKEAYVKARAMGLTIPLHQFCFYFTSQDEIRVRFEPNLRDSESRWKFWQFWVSPDHLTAVCVEREHQRSQSLWLKKVIPLVRAEELAYKHWRTSKAQDV